MNILLWIVLGGIASWIVNIAIVSSNGILEDIILGMVGGFMGGFIFNFIGQQGLTGFNLYSLFIVVSGAVIIIYLGRVIYR